MSCPPEIAEVITEILQLGLVRIRALAWEGNSAGAAHEADHLHNLPRLLRDYSTESMRYYWEVEKPAYSSRAERNAEAQFGPAWQRLHHLLKTSGLAR